MGLDTDEGAEASPEDEAFLGPGGGSAGGGGGGVTGREEDWEIVAEAEVPETCCGFAVLAEVSAAAAAIEKAVFFFLFSIHFGYCIQAGKFG